MSRPFWWFEWETMAELAARILAGGPGSRLEVHLDEAHTMTFEVVGTDVEAARSEPLNKSHVCPPDCP